MAFGKKKDPCPRCSRKGFHEPRLFFGKKPENTYFMTCMYCSYFEIRDVKTDEVISKREDLGPYLKAKPVPPANIVPQPEPVPTSEPEHKPEEPLTREDIEDLVKVQIIDKLSVRVTEGRDYDFGERKRITVRVELLYDNREIASDSCSFSV